MTTKRVKFGFSCKVCGTCFFGSCIIPKTNNTVVNGNPSTKLFCVFSEMNSKKTSFVSSAQLMLVLAVFGTRCFSEIIKSVIRSVAVYVVNVTTWKAPIDIQKREAMRSIGFVINSDCNVSTTMKMPSNSANFGTEGCCFDPAKQSSFKTIVQQLAQSFSRNVCRIFGSHDVTLSQIGKRRGRVDSACLASSLYHVKNALLRLEAIEVEGK